MVIKKHAMDDDFESSRNVVIENNVDYLSYKFDEMDLAASWRVLTKQKLTIVNGIRLENASWRTWAKQRNNLKTISPDTLNWLKDSDVTWLYGPLHTVIKNMDEKDRYAKPKVATTEETLGLMTSQKEESVPEEPTPQKPLKSALKKITMSDLLKRSASELQIHKTAVATEDSISSTNHQLGEFSPAVIANHRQPTLRFNQYVEQCVATTTHNKKPKKKSRLRFFTMNDDDDSSSSGYEPNEDSDGDSMIVMRRPSRVSSIKKIEPTLLKPSDRSAFHYSSSDEDDGPSGYLHSTTVDDWDNESVGSDALLKHLIQASKGKAVLQPVEHPIDDDKNGYEYTFDDDDWDTHSEHAVDDPFSFSQNQYPIIDPPPPVNCEIHPSENNKNNNNNSSNSDSNMNNVGPGDQPASSYSLFSSIAHWASSHFWPTEDDVNKKY